jgi:DNA invertase Pin-like site-specific DNA recombinase
VVKAAGIYARISNDPEDDRLGVTRQVADCEQLAVSKGWPVLDRYIDDDRSAWSGKPRPEDRRLLDDLATGRIDAVLVWHPDRLHRRPIELEEFVEVCKRANVDDVAYVGGDLPVGQDDGLLVARILAAVASDSSAKTAKRIRRKNDERALAGLPVGGGFRPFGYRDDRLRVDPAEAALIRDAAARILSGESVRAIATEWEATGVLSPAGKPFSLHALRRMLASPRLSGQREHRGEIVATGAWEAILTPEQTAALHATFAANRHARRRPTRRYFLTGILRCGRCDATLVSRPTATGTRRYVCAKGVGQTGCGRLAINAEPIEQVVADAILLRLDTPALAAALATAEAGPASADRTALREDEDQLEELAREYGSKRIGLKEWLAARDVIEARMEATRRRLSRLSRTAAIDPYVGHADALAAEWPTMSLNRQRTIADGLLARVTVGPAVPGRTTFDPARIEPLWRV